MKLLRAGDPGFTLVEILISLAVVAMVSVTIVSSVSGMLANTEYLSDKTQAELLARALADDLKVRGVPEKREGSFDSHPEFLWKILPMEKTKDGFIEMLGMREFELVVTSPAGRTGSLIVLLDAPSEGKMP